MYKKILLICFFFIFTTMVHAEQSVDALQNQAFANIKRAKQVVAYAQRLIEVSSTRETAQRCVELYLEAAHLYGNAARLFRAMGPVYVPQEIVDEFAKAELSCLQTVDEIRRLLNKGEIVSTNKETMQSLLKKLKEMSP
jgi:hypothetical protein